jgi:hypothetical protein
MTLTRSRPTYAGVTATLALLVALGGTGYAAANLPRNSVGSPQIVNNSIKSADIKNDGIKGRDVDETTLGRVPTAQQAANADNANALSGRGLRQISQWAIVDSDGGPLSASGTISTSKLGPTGRYRVTFPLSTAGCAANANVTAAAPIADGTTITPGYAVVGRSSANANSVMVQTLNTDGALANLPFVVTVQC